MNPKKTNWPKILMISGSVLVGLIVLGLGGFFGYRYFNQPKQAASSDIIATINGQNITKADLNKKIYSLNFVGTPSSPGKTTEDERKNLLSQLIEDKINSIEAPKLGITVTDEEVTTGIKGSGIDLTKDTEEQKQLTQDNTKANLLRDKIEKKLIGTKSGDYMLFRFDKYFSHDDLNIPGENNSKLIQAQKDHAKTVADQTYADLLAGKVTYDKAVANIKADPQIGTDAFKMISPNMHGSFDQFDYQQKQSYFDENTYRGFRLGMDNSKVNVPTKPYTIQSDTGSGWRDIAYVITIPSAIIDAPYQSVDDYVNSKMKEYNGVVYYKNADINLDAKKFAFQPLVQVAYACPPSYAGGEKTNINVYAYYSPAGGGQVQPYGGVKITLTGGGSTRPYLSIYTTTCGSSTYQYTYAKHTQYNNGLMQSKAYYSGSGERSVLVDCTHTSSATVSWNGDNSGSPVISGSTSGGTWKFVNQNYTLAGNGVAGQSGDGKWINRRSDSSAKLWGENTNSMQIELDLSNPGSSYSSIGDGWANGTDVLKRAVFYPRWIPNQTVYTTVATVKNGVIYRNNDVNNNGGTVTVNKGGTNVTTCASPVTAIAGSYFCTTVYPQNTTLSPGVTATPNTNYSFKGWIIWNANTGDLLNTSDGVETSAQYITNYAPITTSPSKAANLVTLDPNNWLKVGGAVATGTPASIPLHPANPHGVLMDRNWGIMGVFEYAPTTTLTCTISGAPSSNPSSITSATPVTATLIASISSGSISVTKWDFGDGSAPITGTGLSTVQKHSYSTVGNYTATFTNSDGRTATTPCTVTVKSQSNQNTNEVAP